jgi:hypothetical protein
MTCENCKRLELELAKVQAAIRNIRDEAVTLVDARKYPNSVLHLETPKRIKDKANAAVKGDTTALDAAIAAAQQPLVDALERLNEREWYDGTGEIIKVALAKVTATRHGEQAVVEKEGE